MVVLRFKIYLEDYPEVIRIIDVKPTQNFEEFHKSILNSVGFDKSQLASFYLSDENWEKGMEITLLEMEDELEEESDLLVMRNTKVGDVVNDQINRLVYVYDFVLLWSFHIEYEGEEEAEEGERYPRVVEAFGDAPEQYDDADRYPGEVTEDDEEYISHLKKRNRDYLLDDMDEFDEYNMSYDDEFDENFDNYSDEDEDF